MLWWAVELLTVMASRLVAQSFLIQLVGTLFSFLFFASSLVGNAIGARDSHWPRS
jgi:hypothetical protein